MYKRSKLKCWNILNKEKNIFNTLILISECIYIIITHVSLVRMNQHFMTECFECTFTLMMDFQVGISRSIINIECTNIATRWACLNIPSQCFTSQSAITGPALNGSLHRQLQGNFFTSYTWRYSVIIKEISLSNILTLTGFCEGLGKGPWGQFWSKRSVTHYGLLGSNNSGRIIHWSLPGSVRARTSHNPFRVN